MCDEECVGRRIQQRLGYRKCQRQSYHTADMFAINVARSAYKCNAAAGGRDRIVSLSSTLQIPAEETKKHLEADRQKYKTQVRLSLVMLRYAICAELPAIVGYFWGVTDAHHQCWTCLCPAHQ